jgi:hypothetical protein
MDFRNKERLSSWETCGVAEANTVFLVDCPILVGINTDALLVLEKLSTGGTKDLTSLVGH